MKVRFPFINFFRAIYQSPTIADVVDFKKTQATIVIKNAEITINGQRFLRHMARYELDALTRWEINEADTLNQSRKFHGNQS